MHKRLRQDHVYQRAYELAATGMHINPITIVSLLVKEGYAEAAELLNSDIVRADLRRVCAAHWRGVALPEETVVSLPDSAEPLDGKPAE